MWVLIRDVSVSACVDGMWYACFVSAMYATCEYYEFRVWVLGMQCMAAYILCTYVQYNKYLVCPVLVLCVDM